MHRSFVLAAAAMLAWVPLATATWYVQGTAEPDTAQDARDGFMFVAPDRSPSGGMAFFNAWPDLETVGANPNAGHVGSGLFVAPQVRFSALLGVWKDCNGDGFVGMADGALWEYRRELLLDPAPCVGTGHVVGDWVWEFHWLGPGDEGRAGIDASAEAYVEEYGPRGLVNDTAARVWGDWGLPGQAPARTCAVTPPAGTTASTGGLIAYADCFAGRRAQDSANAADPSCDTPTPDMPLCMQGEPQRSGSVLARPLPHLWHDPYHPDSTGLYERGSGDPAFQTWDCSKRSEQTVTEEVAVRDEAGLVPGEVWVNDTPLPDHRVTSTKDQDGALARVPAVVLVTHAPAPEARDPAGSYWDGLNNTADGVNGPCGQESWRFVTFESGSGTVDTAIRPKNQHDLAFRFRATQGFPLYDPYAFADGCTGTQGGQPFPPGCEQYPTQGAIPTSMPKDLGVEAPRGMVYRLLVPGVATTLAISGGVGWRTTNAFPTDPQLVDRDTLAPRGPIHATFYAAVGEATTSRGIRLPGATGVYGVEWCGGSTTGEVAGFDCDASHWWDPRILGTTPMPTQTGSFVTTTCTTGRDAPMEKCREIGVKPGQAYQLRDVDCWDGRVARGVPLHASLVPISGQPGCTTAP